MNTELCKPSKDGVTHINVYSKGHTAIGRFLSNFALAPFQHRQHGHFDSVEGYWYWLSTRVDELRHLSGWQAKQRGREIRTRMPTLIDEPDFQEFVLEAIRQKLRQHPAWWPKLVETGDLPFTHYYVFNHKVIDVTTKNQWQLDEIARIRGILAERKSS